MIKYNFLNGFIERLNTYEIIRSLTFFSLYNEWFLEVSLELHDEILENLSLTTTDKKNYLKYVRKQASEKVVYQNDNKFLEKWIKKYQLEESKFPFIDNEEVQMLLDTDVKDPVLDYKKKKLCTNIQMDFYCHAAMIEKYKMIAFIDDLLENGKEKSYKNEVWFEVGVLLASGKLGKYYIINTKGEISLKNTYTAPRVAEELGDNKYNKIILATLNDYSSNNSNGNKNIFNNRDKMLKIISHCKEQNIPVIPYFTKRLPLE
ncbi:hypothetical protein [uncultured Lutibacter sp.]|uniref:hypothetical protein n=1 Tax=uncultured Lutibacter sp. TaxID=437739 RepID=UPI002606B4B6|nr:hypothetical protein [uncultured Lutibacter sp.]